MMMADLLAINLEQSVESGDCIVIRRFAMGLPALAASQHALNNAPSVTYNGA